MKNNKESKIKTQYVKTDSGKGVIGVYQKPKIYIIYSDTDEMTVTKYLKNSIESTFTFGESFLPNYSVLSDEAKSNYHFYIDKNVYTIYFHEQVKYSYKTSVNEVETEYASSLIQNTEKRQFVLSDKPIYASIRTTKETTQFTADYGDRAKGDTEIYNFNNYIKSQVSFQYVNIKPISYKNFDCVTQLPVID